MRYLGGNTVQQAKEQKDFAVTALGDAKFQLHKWYSNAPELESPATATHTEVSYAKQELGTHSGETKLLGVPWQKTGDTIRMELPTEPSPPTKRVCSANSHRFMTP